MIHKGNWIVLPARLVLHEPQLRLSPLGVVPQRDRRPRTISDYTFFALGMHAIRSRLMADRAPRQVGQPAPWPDLSI
jgi:hypothetical protein